MSRKTIAAALSMAALAVPATANAAADEQMWWQGAEITRTATDGSVSTLDCPSGTGSGRWAAGCRSWLMSPDATGLASSTTEYDVALTELTSPKVTKSAVDFDDFDPTRLKPGMLATGVLEGATYLPGTTAISRKRSGDMAERRSSPRRGITVVETGAQCDPVAGTCSPLDVDAARRLARDPSQGEAGVLYQYGLHARADRSMLKVKTRAAKKKRR